MEVETLTSETFIDVNLVELQNVEKCETNFELADAAESEEPESSEKLKSNSLSKFFRMRGSTCLTLMDDPKPSMTRSFFGFFGKKTKKPADEVADDSAAPDPSHSNTDQSSGQLKSRRSLSMRSLMNLNGQILPWIGIRRSQANLQNPHGAPVKDDNEDELHEIATRSEIF